MGLYFTFWPGMSEESSQLYMDAAFSCQRRKCFQQRPQ